MGRTPTPTNILKARGSRHANRPQEPQAEAFESVPLCPKHLKGLAKRIWDETASILVALRVLTSADIDKLADYCGMRAEFLKLDEKVSKNLDTLSAEKGFPVVVSMRNNARDAMARAGSELGLSPASRTRVRVAAAAAKEDGKAKYFGETA